MKYSYNWLKELSKTSNNPEEVIDALMMHSFEVEGVEKIGSIPDDVVVGKILEIEKHPNADRLQIVSVETRHASSLQVVCGASNIKVNEKVPVALMGAKLPNGIEIKEAEIRGVKSFGMLCAEDELGLGNDHSGIIILEKDAKIGEKVSKVLGLDDTIFEIKVLPDRGHDCLSHVGVAREVAVLSDRKFDYKIKEIKAKKTNKLTVKIEDKNLCPRYIGAILENVKIQPSPAWMKNRLLSLGVKPINNVVDATNYVMLELGQPLHAFDIKKLANDERIGSESVRIVVRRAKEGEEIKLLDETIKKLSSEDLVIANEEKALALAGIMGGEDSGIGNDTTAIVLESANFNATNIRKSRTKLNIKTEASDRYEKGIDPNLCELAMARVIEIIKSYGANDAGIVDNYPSAVKPWQVKLDLEYANRLLGEEIQSKAAVKILELLGMKVKLSGHWVTCVIPTIRIDLKTQEDLIEEIGRIYGYEKIKSQTPNVSVQAAKVNENREFERRMKNVLIGDGFSEVYNYSFYGVQDAKNSNSKEANHLELENPINPEQALVRASLIPNILKNIKENLKNFNELQIFEIGKVYLSNSDKFPEEKNMLVGALVLEKDKKADTFYQMKGYVEAILEKLGISGYNFESFTSSDSVWHPTRCAEIKANGKNIGYLGEISPLAKSNFDIKKRVAMIEFDLKKLQEISELKKEFVPIRKYPVSTRDISMASEAEIKVDDILKNIKKSGGELVLNVELFDIFDFEEKKEKSFAFRISFGTNERTLRNEEIDEAMKKIAENLEKELKVKVRK